MGFRHSVFYYIVRNTRDSLCLTWAFIIGVVSLAVLIVFYAFPSLYIPVSWSEERINNVNNLIVTLSSGYLVTYISYFLTITIPTAVKTQYKRVALSENARYLESCTYNLLNALCEFREDQDVITNENLSDFTVRNCDVHLGRQINTKSKHYLEESYGRIKEVQMTIEKDLEYLYGQERKILISLDNARMWKMMKQLMQGAIFNLNGYRDFLNEILHYRKCAICLYNMMEDGKFVGIEKNIDIQITENPKKICSFISIINVNNNH